VSNWTELGTVVNTITGSSLEITLATPFDTSDYKAQITIRQGANVSILGHGAVLNASRTGYFFLVNTGAWLSLDSLVLRNGYAGSGSSGGNSGGAINNHGQLSVGNSSFIGNYATNGGAFANNPGGKINVNCTSFEHNTATGGAGGGGGAIWMYGGTLILSNSKFTFNAATSTTMGKGGALFVQHGGIVTIVSTEFANNTAPPGKGGNIYILNQSASAHPNLHNIVTFVGFCNGAKIPMADCCTLPVLPTCNPSSWTELGTVINTNTGSSLEITLATPFDTSDYSEEIYIRLPSMIVTILGQGAVLDAAGKSQFFVVLVGAWLVLDSVTLQNGSAPYYRNSGGAIWNQGKLTVGNSSFIGNHADNNGGGAIINFNGTAAVNSTTFQNNSASQGGAIWNYGKLGSLVLNNSMLASSVAKWGGAIDVQGGADTLISLAQFANNSATNVSGKGNDIFIESCGGTVTFISCNGTYIPMTGCCSLPTLPTCSTTTTAAPKTTSAAPTTAAPKTTSATPTTAAPKSTSSAPTTAAPKTTSDPTTTAAPKTSTAPTTTAPNTTSAPSTVVGMGTVVAVAVSCIAATAMAAAACYFSNERRKRRRPEANQSLLMEEQHLGLGAESGTTGLWNDNGGLDCDTGGGGGCMQALSAEPADYDVTTGTPVNMTAKKEVVREWNKAACKGTKVQVVELRYDELVKATGDFDEFNQVGHGASCSVFTGRVFGITVAVKLLKDTAVEWEQKQFASEMEILSTASHPNICRLLAFSTDGPQRCLVLDLCVGGTLSARLACRPSSGRPPPIPLTWQRRVWIALGIARALEYLHGLTPQMIHRDLKTPNVLLDDRDNAKVADFGTVREGVTKDAATHTITGAAVGTNGYMPMEYINHGQVSTKLDVYAFAIVLIELLTAKCGIEVARLHCDEPDLFSEITRYIDARAARAWPAASVKALAAIAEQCISFQARSRPEAGEVVSRLEELVLTEPTAQPLGDKQ
jgi:serine/threonine protein kinase